MTTQPSEPNAAGSARSELHALVVAASAWLGAVSAGSVFSSRWSVVLAAVLVVPMVLKTRSSLLLALPAFVVASHLSLLADRGYVPMAAGPVAATAEVLSDPEPIRGGWLIELRLPGGERVQARAYGGVGVAVTRTSVGETLSVRGTVKPVVDQPWLRSRHITGRLTVSDLEPLKRPALHHRPAEFIRSRIAAGTSAMSDRERALYLGLVVGDDRFQPLGQRLKFRAAGLTHLLAVSGQNVAFALVVARPLLQRLGYRSRFVGLLAVLVLFAVMTRLEPSVLRATATAGLAAWATQSGRERSGLTVLALAVVALICIDPFLVDVIGFQLSVAASAGILIVGPVAERRLPGPDWLRAPLAVTVSAQLGVSPLLGLYFGPVSVASIPANLLAGWAAAAIMTIGLSSGIIAGLLPGSIGRLMQLPAELLLWWIEAVASFFGPLPAPRLGMFALAATGGALVLIKVARSRLTAMIPTLMILAILIGAVPRAPATATVCGAGISWYPSGAAMPRGDAVPDADTPDPDIPDPDTRVRSALVLTGDAGDRSLEACFDRGVREVDVLILERGGASTARLVAAAREVFAVGDIVAPPQHRVIGARRQLQIRRIRVHGAVLTVKPMADRTRLQVLVEVADLSDSLTVGMPVRAETK